MLLCNKSVRPVLEVCQDRRAPESVCQYMLCFDGGECFILVVIYIIQLDSGVWLLMILMARFNLGHDYGKSVNLYGGRRGKGNLGNLLLRAFGVCRHEGESNHLGISVAYTEGLNLPKHSQLFITRSIFNANAKHLSES